MGEIGRRAQHPAAGGLHEVHATPCIVPRQRVHEGADVRFRRKLGRKGRRINGGRRGEKQRLHHPQIAGEGDGALVVGTHIEQIDARGRPAHAPAPEGSEATARGRSHKGAKGSSWRMSSMPSRTISRLAEKLEASAVARSAGSAR